MEAIIAISEYKCFSLAGVRYTIETNDIAITEKKLKDALNLAMGHIESDNPRYYRLKDKVVNKGLSNKLW